MYDFNTIFGCLKEWKNCKQTHTKPKSRTIPGPTHSLWVSLWSGKHCKGSQALKMDGKKIKFQFTISWSSSEVYLKHSLHKYIKQSYLSNFCNTYSNSQIVTSDCHSTQSGRSNDDHFSLIVSLCEFNQRNINYINQSKEGRFVRDSSFGIGFVQYHTRLFVWT